MTTTEETRIEVEQLVKSKLPDADISRIDVQEKSDSEGQPSFNIWIVFKSALKKKETRQMLVLLDELRTWLAEKGDDRFPYLSFITESEENELHSDH